MTFINNGKTVNSVFVAGGELGDLMRSLDWSQTALGDVNHWLQSLRSAISILLPSKAQIALFWGSELVLLYNDSYRPALASKHPWALGRPAREVFSELWDVLEPLLVGVMTTGEAFWAKDHPFFTNRYGYLEETYFDISYDPVRDESGDVGGVFCIVSETTGRVLGDRRLQLLSLLARETAQTKTVKAACQTAMQALTTNPHDIPFALLYQVEPSNQAMLVETTGIDPETPATPSRIDLTIATDVWKLGQVYQTRQAIVLENLTERFGALPSGAWETPPTAAWIMPLAQAGQDRVTGFLVLGINPYRTFEQEYREFFELVAGNVTTAIANASAFEQERQRVETLAELDRAKTSFFSNVSHEFRTPLTLMLSPLEQTLIQFRDTIPQEARSQLEVVQRNGKRLLKLVNALLDFSRLEAGRVQARFAPTDLAAYTIELSSLFQSTIEQAGLRFQVDCSPLPDLIYVDREMWEKVVSNLLSNAFKFTLSGEISVSLRPIDRQVELTVRDTGTGIPTAELPKLFERFHRVEGTRGRSFEGTGIGLSLVQEVVRLHGGTIAVESVLGQGSTFRVRLPIDAAHLPVEQLASDGHLTQDTVNTAFEVEEVFGWVSQELDTAWQQTEEVTSSPASARILVVDDNADMRRYLHRILSRSYQVKLVASGTAALAVIAQSTPDLILSDVMMPDIDGFALLRRLRSHPSTRDIPILLLSARAGEEAAVEGLSAGADDYLMKPFSARELLARVAANVQLGQSRQAAARRHLDAVVSSVPDFIYTFDLAGRFTYINKPLLDLWQKSYSEAVGKTFFELDYPVEVAARLQQQIQQVITTRQSLRDETPYTSVPGTRAYEYIFVPLLDASGAVYGVVGTTRDITDRKQIELEREQILQREQAARETAERANQIKDEFLAVLSHELRTPLNPILGWIRILRNGNLDATKTAQAMETIERNTNLQVQLIEDLLDISRILQGKLSLTIAPVKLDRVIALALETVRLAAESKLIQIETVVSPISGAIKGDSGRLQQVIWNLLSNAVKFTPPSGQIQVTLAQVGMNAQIEVRDTGKGIHPNFLPYVFEHFRQQDGTTTRKFGGLGLGLAIARQIVELHGGTIGVESAGEEQGATFTVKLPLFNIQAPVIQDDLISIAPSSALPLANIRILVVDDEIDTRNLTAFVLEAEGAIVMAVPSALAALEVVTQFQPDVLVSDIGMPEMDGYALIRQIRQLPNRIKHIPALALTAYAGGIDQQQSISAGFQSHLAKPVEPTALVAQVASLI